MLLPPPSPMALSVCVGDPQSAQVPGAAITRRRARGACKGGAHGTCTGGSAPPAGSSPSPLPDWGLQHCHPPGGLGERALNWFRPRAPWGWFPPLPSRAAEPRAQPGFLHALPLLPRPTSGARSPSCPLPRASTRTAAPSPPASKKVELSPEKHSRSPGPHRGYRAGRPRLGSLGRWGSGSGEEGGPGQEECPLGETGLTAQLCDPWAPGSPPPGLSCCDQDGPGPCGPGPALRQHLAGRPPGLPPRPPAQGRDWGLWRKCKGPKGKSWASSPPLPAGFAPAGVPLQEATPQDSGDTSRVSTGPFNADTNYQNQHRPHRLGAYPWDCTHFRAGHGPQVAHFRPTWLQIRGSCDHPGYSNLLEWPTELQTALSVLLPINCKYNSGTARWETSWGPWKGPGLPCPPGRPPVPCWKLSEPRPFGFLWQVRSIATTAYIIGHW